MEPDAFDTFYRGCVDNCLAAGLEPRTREYTAAMVAQWEMLFSLPAHTLPPTDSDRLTPH